MNDRYLETLIRGTLGSGYYIAGNFAQAHHYLQQAVQTSQAMRLPGLSIVTFTWLSSLCIQMGRYELAASYAQEAQKNSRQLGRHSIEMESAGVGRTRPMQPASR